jgi:hypothetical protein
MKCNTTVFFAFLLVFNAFQIQLLHAQETLKNQEDIRFITKFDVGLFTAKELPGFRLEGESAKWNFGREYFYINDSRIPVYFTIGLYSSAEDAEKIALDYLSNFSMIMNHEDHHKGQIGDRFWWWSAVRDNSYLTHIVFIRNNAFIALFSRSYKELKNLAKKIDEGILQQEPFVSCKASIHPPEIRLLMPNRNMVNMGDTTGISFTAVDPGNEPLEFRFLPGVRKDKSKPGNHYIFKASPNYTRGKPGICTLKVVAINENNVVSPVSEIEIQCVE